MKIISLTEVKQALDKIPVSRLLQAIEIPPKVNEEIAQVNIDEPGSHRVVAHVAGVNDESYACKYAVSTPKEKDRAKITLLISDQSGKIEAIIEGTWISHYRTALRGIQAIINTQTVESAFILGRGPVGKSVEYFLNKLGVKTTIYGRDYKFQKADALFVAITEDSEKPIWELGDLFDNFKVVCDFTRHSVKLPVNLDKNKDAFLPGPNGIYIRHTGSIAYDLALASLIMHEPIGITTYFSS